MDTDTVLIYFVIIGPMILVLVAISCVYALVMRFVNKVAEKALKTQEPKKEE